MNCKQVRQYLYAFADGQIDVRANCEVLDHLKMCPSCSEIVGEQQALRESIARSARRIKAPAALESKIKLAILSGASPDSVHRRGSGRGVARLLALAACLAFSVIAAWQYGTSRGGRWSALAGDSLAIANASRDVASSIVVRHNKCAVRCEKQAHQSETLPTSASDLPAAVCGQLGQQVFAVAPDLTPFHYEFESANICRIQGEQAVNAAHFMYVNFQFGTRLSLFSIPRWQGIDIAREATRENPFISDWPGCENNLSVVAWHDAQTTYILCGPLDSEDMLEVAELVQSHIPVRR